MAVTDDQVAALRAFLTDPGGEYRVWVEHLDRQQGWKGYDDLVAAAFFDAVERHFDEEWTAAQVVQFVASARARLEELGDSLDPVACERLIKAVLGEGDVHDLDANLVGGLEVALLAVLVSDQELSGEDLDEFLKDAREVADEFTSAN